MARVSTVADIKEMDADDIVKCFTGKVKKSFGIKKGSNDKGDWSFQHFIMKDPDGDEIKLTLKNREKEDFKIGDTITVSAHRGKNDWTGLYAKDDEYDGKTSRILQATATAEIEEGSGSNRGDDGDRERDNDRPSHKDDDRQERSSRREDDRSDRKRDDNDDRKRDDRKRDDDRKSDDERDPVRECKHGLMKLTNLAGLTLEASAFALQQFERRSDIMVPPEAIFRLANAFFIELRKQGIGDELPIKPLWEIEEEENDKEKENEKEEPKSKKK